MISPPVFARQCVRLILSMALMFGVSASVVVVPRVILSPGTDPRAISIPVCALCRTLVTRLGLSRGPTGPMTLVAVFVSSMTGVLR